ncbi:hypothetical protein [Rhodococcus opacus]|nr:hypothetical protein [Rhodococcus opacus]
MLARFRADDVLVITRLDRLGPDGRCCT